MTNNNDMNEFKDLEATLKKAFNREKQQGLAPQQLRALHDAIDRGSVQAKPRRRWWQWSVAGSLLATALVAVVVVDRFPRTQDVMTETAAPLAKKQKKESRTLEVAPEPEAQIAVADGRGVMKDAPAEKAKEQKASDRNVSARKRDTRQETTLAKTTQPKPASPAKPKTPAPANAGPKGMGLGSGKMIGSGKSLGGISGSVDDKGQWETKSQLSDGSTAPAAKTEALVESAEFKSDNDAAPAAFGSGAGGAGAGGVNLSNTGNKSLGLAQPGAPSQSSPAKAKKAAAEKPQARKKAGSSTQIEIASTAFKGKGSPASVKAVINANMGGLRGCYADLLTRNPSAKGSMSLVWQIPNFKLKMSSDVFADTKMRECVQKNMAGWSYPDGTVGNAEATLRFGYGK